MNYIFFSAKSEIEKIEKHYINSDLKHIYLKHKEEILIILNCVEKIEKENRITEEDLKILENGIKNSWEEVFFYQAGKYVSHYSFKFKEVEQLFYKLINNKDYKNRFRILTVLLNEPPRKITKEVLSKALNDKSLTIQKKAEDIIIRLNAKHKYNFFQKLSIQKLKNKTV
ncbi:hypothetical protein [Flavobacterium okayamense]|uniref:HEAT repeat domain-containing protein n=1 Tax=Flavobacterium okayamense TaxID=2830782 RepID=A0ABM7S706_9FLAO|nr:hypothetical protein [Flavobacterium okayamense]BCY29157.1 hypothetical protein KK2020170_20250 [Flavobacterium okayamense]